jgi:hypothetical protein
MPLWKTGYFSQKKLYAQISGAISMTDKSLLSKARSISLLRVAGLWHIVEFCSLATLAAIYWQLCEMDLVKLNQQHHAKNLHFILLAKDFVERRAHYLQFSVILDVCWCSMIIHFWLIYCMYREGPI